MKLRAANRLFPQLRFFNPIIFKLNAFKSNDTEGSLKVLSLCQSDTTEFE